MIERITKDVWSFCIVPFFGAIEYCRCFRVSKYIQRTTRLGIYHRKHLELRGGRNECRMLRIFAQYARSLRVIDVRLSNRVCVDTICDLIRESPHLEAFMTASGESRILDTLVRYCPKLVALALCTCSFSMSNLYQFRYLKALELGCARHPMIISKPETITALLERHPYITILHILGARSTPEMLHAINPDTVRSIAFPYDRERITAESIAQLRPFHRLDNLNFGESPISEDAVAQVAIVCPGITKFSVSPRVSLDGTLAELGNRELFQNLCVLGCRTPERHHEAQIRESVFTVLGVKRRWDIVDYAITLPHAHDHWCRTPFEFMTLLKEYGLISKF